MPFIKAIAFICASLFSRGAQIMQTFESSSPLPPLRQAALRTALYWQGPYNNTMECISSASLTRIYTHLNESLFHFQNSAGQVYQVKQRSSKRCKHYTSCTKHSFNKETLHQVLRKILPLNFIETQKWQKGINALIFDTFLWGVFIFKWINRGILPVTYRSHITSSLWVIFFFFFF